MIRWISFQSLIGGEMIGAEKAFGTPPLMTIDYEGVKNSELYVDWMKSRGLDIPHIVLDGTLLSKTETIKEGKEAFDKLNHDIDVVCAVPICSGLSHANSSKTGATARGSDACQNNNMLGIEEFVLKIIKPKVYLFENAPALFTVSTKDLREKINEIAFKYGYSVSYIKTDTQFHGLPQKRSRTFCIIWQGNQVGVLENPPKISPIPLAELLSNTEGLNGADVILFNDFENDPYIKYCYAKYGKEHYREEFNDTPRDILRKIFKNNDVEFAKEVNKDNEKFCKYMDYAKDKFDKGMNVMDASPLIFAGDSLCCTIFARNQRRIVHPTEERGLNLRELMRMMGMPDDFPITKDYEAMIGQNVPVNTTKYYCEQIKKYLEGNLPTEQTEVMFQRMKPEIKYTQLEFDF